MDQTDVYSFSIKRLKPIHFNEWYFIQSVDDFKNILKIIRLHTNLEIRRAVQVRIFKGIVTARNQFLLSEIKLISYTADRGLTTLLKHLVTISKDSFIF